jgi:uncharacterized Zn finger protein
MPITNKVYYCPLCGSREDHSTNHIGEIYCHCRNCGNNPLYCEEMDYSKFEYTEAILHYYRFSINESRQLNQYNTLKEYLRDNLKYKIFDVIELNAHQIMQGIMLRDSETIKLYKPFHWPDQFVSNIGRVHKWKEVIYPNKNVKEGYYLEFKENRL